MKGISWGLIIGVSVGVIIGVSLAVSALFCIRHRRKSSQIRCNSCRRTTTIPIRVNGFDSSTVLSDSTNGQDSPRKSDVNSMFLRLEGHLKKNLASASGVPKYSYKDIQKATYNFTTVIGKGAFGPVYKAQMATGKTVAVKVLATNSRQGEKEFQAEVLLLGRLHHRNLVNLIGYCAERGQHMLLYVYMSNGNLASHLYRENCKPLSWKLRVCMALDIARGLEYLHYGVADFGLSREEMINPHASDVRGTYGYLDPEYMSTRTFTKKSDVYSFGVLLFELITGRNPLQGLMEYVELAMMDTEGEAGWEEVVDSRIDGSFDVQELNDVASLAYKCINHVPRNRPSMRDVVLVLSRIHNLRHSRKGMKHTLPPTVEEVSVEVDESKSTATNVIEFQRESVDSTKEYLEI
ncbi:calcium/calmodulin-regulated receptor-like kinase 1 isoform X2 [Malania oleifera]|uniref:calcium/calmodulin-regulated receptor-like kinase 1 isoform X2 n=1 Tax=Malania oleifera TaxID=397392 RepID=UPI0025AE4BFB|nr:calcium/calmodulin-regulated receptor-like kinase 1 isoform X2 [Malania oleifera]